MHNNARKEGLESRLHKMPDIFFMNFGIGIENKCKYHANESQQPTEKDPENKSNRIFAHAFWIQITISFWFSIAVHKYLCLMHSFVEIQSLHCPVLREIFPFFYSDCSQRANIVQGCSNKNDRIGQGRWAKDAIKDLSLRYGWIYEEGEREKEIRSGTWLN